MPDTTERLLLPLIVAGQIDADKAYNEAIYRLEAMSVLNIKDRDLTTPPGSPAQGDTYLVAATATGTWTGQDNKIAIYFGTSWYYIVASEGMIAWIADEDVMLVHNGSSWISPERTGTATMASGTVTVTNALCKTSSNVQITRKTGAGTLGHLRCVPGNGSFVITSSSGTEANDVMWLLVP
jgi:hypothetical protein